MDQEPHQPGRGKGIYVSFRAGSELLPVRSGAGKPWSLKFLKLYGKTRNEPGISSAGDDER
jgi:hypothetical protein